MKRERPPMPPLSVKVKVAERQFAAKPTNAGMELYLLLAKDWSLARRLKWLLLQIFITDSGGKVAPHALDHDPALILRPYNPRIENVAARYTPHAHDPDFLIYREKADHQQKTTGRRPGASRTITTKGSDIGLKTKFARLERRENAKKKPGFSTLRNSAKRAIPSRPFQSGRKFRKPSVDKS